jgi:predicted Rossmann fold flavoprotein
MYDIAIIGAGAAGLTAAIFAARAGARVAALDGAARLGAKILIAGGGRCNVTHDVVTPNDFNGNRNAIAKVLRTFPVDATLMWFAEMGVQMKREEGGKLFPTTNRAQTVLDALVHDARASGVAILTSHRVDTIKTGFVINGTTQAKRVILATGGRSVPKTGSDGGGYDLAHALGHTITNTFPALVPLVIEQEHWFRELSGTSAEVDLAVTTASGRVIVRHRGSMLLTHFGISGPVALDISRHWIEARAFGARLVVSFLPDETFESVEKILLDAARKNPQATVGSSLRGQIPERILDRIAEPVPIAKLSRDARRAIARDLTALEVPVARDRGFDYAEVTAGGIPLDEVNLATMESRRCPGLFLCGEILDVDGRIGGYNFQWAWASGRLAGLSAARREV